MKPRIVLALAVVALALLGTIALFRPRSQPHVLAEPERPPTPVNAEVPVPPSAPSVTSAPPAAPAPPEAAKADEKVLQRARDFIDEYFKAIDAKDDKLQGRLLARFGELSPEMVPHLLERFEAESDRAKRSALLLMAYAAGGEHLGAYLEDKLLDPAAPPERVHILLGVMGNPNHEVNALYQQRPYPIDEKLARKALDDWSVSTSRQHRSGAARILGFLPPSPENMARLIDLAWNDRDVSVRASAILSLGRVGDQETRKLLESYAYPQDDGTNYLLQGAMREARTRLARK